ncbi:MAG TPA: hypothetical protein VNS55_12545 [Nocardioides sp.]|nr:hypothetical protein [Nocardioides sp.]
MLPRFEVVSRFRPVAVVGTPAVEASYVDAPAPEGATASTPHPAPYAAVEVDLAPVAGSGTVMLELIGPDGTVLSTSYDAASGAVALEVTVGGATVRRRSRRFGRAKVPPARLGLALTGAHLAALTLEDGAWVVRGRVALEEDAADLDPRDVDWLAGLVSGWRGPGATGWRAGGFGRLGLRDVRVVTRRDGSPYRPDGRLLLTATSAGPGFFDTAHTSVWSLDLGSGAPELRHLSDLFFGRPDAPGAYGDHATHLVRDGDAWLVATSTWGNFDQREEGATVAITLAESRADLLQGRHLLPTRALDVPTDGLTSVGVWDPHLVHTGEEWLVGFVSARRFFAFHPAYAAGPDLDRLTLRGAAGDRRATEGTTLLRHDGRWLLLASDGADNPRAVRRRYPVFELGSGVDGVADGLTEVGELAAPYGTNIPWPTLVQPESADEPWWLVTFDGTSYGGALPGYGTHGDVVLMRSAHE